MRTATNKILEMIDEGVLDKDFVIGAALKYMSEDDVSDMAYLNEMFYDEEDEEDEEWSPYTADYCDVGSHHHW